MATKKQAARSKTAPKKATPAAKKPTKPVKTGAAKAAVTVKAPVQAAKAAPVQAAKAAPVQAAKAAPVQAAKAAPVQAAKAAPVRLANDAPAGLAAQVAELRRYFGAVEEALASHSLPAGEREHLERRLASARRALLGSPKERDARRAQRFLAAYVGASRELEHRAHLAAAVKAEAAHYPPMPSAVVTLACSDTARRILVALPKADEADRVALRDALAVRLRRGSGGPSLVHASAEELLARVANRNFGVTYTPEAVHAEIREIRESLGLAEASA